MSIVISNFAAISGYLAYCAAIGLGSYSVTSMILNQNNKDKKDDVSENKTTIENDINSAYIGFKYDIWKNENSNLLNGLSDTESFNKFKESPEYSFDYIFEDMKTLSAYKLLKTNNDLLKSNGFNNNFLKPFDESWKFEDAIDSFKNNENIVKNGINKDSIMFEKVKENYTLDGVNVNNIEIKDWNTNISIYDSLIKNENLNTNINDWKNDLTPDKNDFSQMFSKVNTTKPSDWKIENIVDFSKVMEEYEKSIIENLKNKNPNDIIFANENVLKIQNEMSIALNLSPEEKELHKENTDLYQMLIDNKKVYDEAISTIQGKYSINQIDGFKNKYLENNQEIVDQINKNIDSLKELENNKKESEIKSIAD